LINFCFGIHNHQPVGNFDHVIQHAYDQCYLPFIKTIAEFPAIKVTLHNTGILWDWIEKNQPEYFDYIHKLLKTGQLEILSGGFYEPILPIILDQHKKGQIKKLTAYIKEHFEYDARGMWLAERVWEPQLADIINSCNIEYTILDDTHFRWAGLTEDQLNGYFITEEQHKKLALFPISKQLRYAIPFYTVDKVMDLFRQLAQESPEKLTVYADDGEKFGSWPDTFKLCYEEKWLAKFFEAVSENSDWLNMTFFSEAMDKLAPNGRVYLPTASYAEMGQWSLPPAGFNHYEEIEKQFKDSDTWDSHGYLVRGGFWRNFLTKYTESNNMHKKMYRVASKIAELPKTAVTGQAFDLLFQGQCNCPYWHGVFGGLYLNHLRYATYNRLLQAESIADMHGVLSDDGEIIETDFDDDGNSELLVETQPVNAYFSPRFGGAMFELDLKDRGYNVLDTMTRREEGYHKKLLSLKDGQPAEGASIHDRIEAKEEGLDKYLIYDWYRRSSFIDHLLEPATTLAQFSGNKYDELGDFVIEPYEYRFRKLKDKLRVVLDRDGNIFTGKGNGRQANPLTISKQIDIGKIEPGIAAAYSLENRSKSKLVFKFAIEFNWSMLAGDAPDRYYYVVGQKLDDARMVSRGENSNFGNFGIIDKYHDLDISFKPLQPCTLWRFPIETVSLSEFGFERVYQSSVTCLGYDIKLAPGETQELNFVIEFKNCSL